LYTTKKIKKNQKITSYGGEFKTKPHAMPRIVAMEYISIRTWFWMGIAHNTGWGDMPMIVDHRTNGLGNVAEIMRDLAPTQTTEQRV
jgi:hypothetical protein